MYFIHLAIICLWSLGLHLEDLLDDDGHGGMGQLVLVYEVDGHLLGVFLGTHLQFYLLVHDFYGDHPFPLVLLFLLLLFLLLSPGRLLPLGLQFLSMFRQLSIELLPNSVH